MHCPHPLLLLQLTGKVPVLTAVCLCLQAALRLTPQQRAQLLQARADMFAKLNKLLQERRMLMWHMQVMILGLG